jgi:hypothetical protein
VAYFGNLLILRRSLMGCNIVFKCGKDSLFILATKRKEDFRINSTFRSDFLVYLGLLKGDKSDSSIFRMVIFKFLLFLLFSSYFFGLLLLIWVNYN